MPVNTPRKDYEQNVSKWERLRDTSGGRDAIIAAGAKYLPSLPGATFNTNDAYLKRGNFYNAVGRTVDGMVGMLYQKKMTIEAKPLEDFLTDITLTNMALEMFCNKATQEVTLMGRYGILVEMTNRPPIPGQPAPVQRPYLVGHCPENIINWTVTRVGGEQVLTRVVLKEHYEIVDPADEFVVKCEPQYRVLDLVNGIYTQQVWRKEDKKETWVRFGSPIVPLRRGTPLNFIPFVFMGPMHVTPDIEESPLDDLAQVNLAHWRNSADHEHGLHLVALPTPWVSGNKTAGGPGASSQPMKIGPSTVWELDVNGSAGFLEFSGAGLEAIALAMEKKEKQMAALGARLLEEQASTQETATAVGMRHAGDHATLRTIAAASNQAFTMALQMMAWWIGGEAKPADVLNIRVELNKHYLNIKLTPQEAQTALLILQAGHMSYENFWHLLVTGGWGREGVSAEDERKQIDKDIPDELAPLDPREALEMKNKKDEKDKEDEEEIEE